MSLLFRSWPTAAELIPRREGRRSHRVVSASEAMRSSAVWGCLRLRADLISTSPVDVYRKVDGRAVTVPTPPVLVNPGGSKVDICEWLYSTQVDLDRFGNCFGLITARDGLGLPARIDLLEGETVTVRTSNGQITEFKAGTKTYSPEQIWHEKQYTVAGLPVGLSPLAAASLVLNTHLSAQEFAGSWFSGGAVPSAHLKNTAKTLTEDQADTVKTRFNTSVRTGDVFVTGSDWDYEMLGAKASESSFLEAIDASALDICRYLSVPGDMIDVAPSGQSVTYANITQRNLQLLIMNLGPAVTRREKALTRVVAPPRYVKLNSDAAVLRMDPLSRAELNKVLVDSGQRSMDEIREKDDMAPLADQAARDVDARSNALGVLVRSGFDPKAAALALGLPPIEHTGAFPVTVQNPSLVEGPLP